MLIGARTAAWSGGKKFSALDYIGAKEAKESLTSPLVSMWDGIENAGWGIHENNNKYISNLVDGGVFGNFIFFSSSEMSDEKSFPPSTASNNVSIGNCATCEICLIQNRKDGENFTSFIGLGPGDSRFGSWSYGRSVITGSNYRTNYSAFQNHCTVSFLIKGGDFLTIYENGELKENISSNVGSIGRVRPAFAVYNNQWQNNEMRCHSFRIYNRELSQIEILNNYKIDKVRFNLP